MIKEIKGNQQAKFKLWNGQV